MLGGVDWQLPTFRDTLSILFSVDKESSLALEDGNDVWFRNVRNNQSTLRSVPEGRRSHLHSGGSL